MPAFRRLPAQIGGAVLFRVCFQFLVCILGCSLTIGCFVYRYSWQGAPPTGLFLHIAPPLWEVVTSFWQLSRDGSTSRLHLAQVQKTLKHSFVIPKAVLIQEPHLVTPSMLIKQLSLLFGRKHPTTFLALVPKSQLAHLRLELWVAPLWGAAIYLHHLLIITLWIMHH